MLQTGYQELSATSPLDGLAGHHLAAQRMDGPTPLPRLSNRAPWLLHGLKEGERGGRAPFLPRESHIMRSALATLVALPCLPRPFHAAISLWRPSW